MNDQPTSQSYVEKLSSTVDATQGSQVVVFQLDGEEYAVPTDQVREVVKVSDITPVPQSPEYIVGIMNLRGRVVPVVDLEKRFQLTRDAQTTCEHILIIEGKNSTLFGFLVDKVIEVLKITPDQIRSTPKLVMSKISEDYLKGVAVIGGNHTEGEEVKDQPESESRILLLLDVEKIVSIEDLPVTV